MRKLLLILLLSVCASATTTVTGTIQTLGTGNVTNGAYVRFWLRGCGGNQPRINGTGIIAPTQGAVYYFDFPANASGQVSGTLYSTRDSTGLLGGDIECGGSHTSVWYGMQVFTGGKGGPEVAVHAKSGGTLDVSSVTPITTNPVIASPTGDGTYLRLDAGNSPVTGPVSFNNTVTATHGGTLGGTYAGNPTLSGNPLFSGNPIFSGNVTATAGQNTFSAFNLDNVVYIDGLKYACSDVGFNAAFAALPSAGGTIDARGCTAATTVASTVAIGSGTKPATLLFNARVQVTCTITNGNPCFTIAAGSQLWVDALTPIGTQGTYNFQLGASANVSSLIENAPKDGTMPIGGIWIHGGLWGNNNGGTVNGALLDFQGIFANSVIEDVTTAACKSTTCVRIQPGTGANSGSKLFSDVLFLNDNINCSNATGCSPLLIQLPAGASGSSGVSVVNFQDSYVQDPGPNQRLLYINGNGVTNGISNVYFTNTDLELATPGGAQDCTVQITDAAHIKFDGVWTGGVSTGTNFLCISQSVSNATGDIIVNNFHDGVSGWTNVIHNTISSVNITNKDFSDYIYGGTYAGVATVAITKNWDTVPLNILNGSPVTLTIASGTAAMPTSAVAAISGSTVTCVAAAGNPFTATGVATTDTIIFSPNASESSPNTGLFIRAWPTSGGVNFEYCNSSASNLTPGAETLNWRVVR